MNTKRRLCSVISVAFQMPARCSFKTGSSQASPRSNFPEYFTANNKTARARTVVSSFLSPVSRNDTRNLAFLATVTSTAIKRNKKGCAAMRKSMLLLQSAAITDNNNKQLRFSSGLAVAKKLVDSAPVGFQPYLRLMRADRPIGTWLLFWPCTWSIGLATQAGCFPDLKLLALFGAGSFFMRGAGCVVNDLWDKDFDKKVERTKSRPLPSGELSEFQALTLLAGLLSISLSILLQLNWCSVVVGASSLVLVAAYPLAKRYTYWPQFILGITLNWGVLIAWSHLSDSCLPVLPLYSACVCYTIIYDTIYSHQDKTDDIMIGVKSTALKFGDDTKYWLSGFAGLMMLGLTSTGILCEQTWPYYASLVAVGSHLAWQVGTVDISSAADCWSKFRSNQVLGLLLFLGIVSGTLMKENSEEKKSETDLLDHQ